MTAIQAERASENARPARQVILLLAVFGFGTLVAGLYFDLTWHTLRYKTGISINRDLTIREANAGAQAAGLRVGDQLLAVNGQKITTVLEYRKSINDNEADTEAILLVQRGAQTLTVSGFVEAKKPDLRLIVRNLVALSFLMMGTLVGWQRPGDKVARLFFLIAMAMGVYFALALQEATILVCIQIFVLTLAPGLVLHFFLSFPREREIVKTSAWLLLYIPSLILMGATMLTFWQSLAEGTGIWNPRFGALTTIDFAYLASSAALGLILLGYAYTAAPHSILKRQLQWIMWGLAIAIVAGLADVVLTWMDVLNPVLSNLLLLGAFPLPISFAFSILHYHLLDIDLVINRSMVYGVLTALLAAVYLLLVAMLSAGLGAVAPSGSYTLVLFLSALLIGLLMNPIRLRLQTLIDRLFFKHQLDYQRTLRQWSEELSTSIRFTDLARLLLREIPKQLMLDRAWLLVLNEDETYLSPLPARSTGDTDKTKASSYPPVDRLDRAGLPVLDDGAEPKLSIPAYSAFALELNQPGMILVLSGGREKNRSEDVQDAPPAWTEAGVRIAFPLVSAEKLLGIYLLGSKLSGDIYQREELNLLRTVANQAAISIGNTRLYEEVRASSKELEETVKERTKELRDFVSVVYHELRTPITAIQGYTALLLEEKAGSLTDKQARYLGSVDSSIQRLTDLVDDLSDISEIEAGRLAIDPEPLNLRQVVEDTVSSLSATIEEKGLQVKVSVPPDTEMIVGDPRRVAQIFTNLVSNACRYTPAGGQICIAASNVNGRVALTIQDTGIGIRREEVDRIFERFYRSDDPMVRDQSGTGLGLAITRSLVQLHGSQLWVRSNAGKGSTFGFSLPLAQDYDAKDPGTTDER